MTVDSGGASSSSDCIMAVWGVRGFGVGTAAEVAAIFVRVRGRSLLSVGLRAEPGTADADRPPTALAVRMRGSPPGSRPSMMACSASATTLELFGRRAGAFCMSE